MTENGDEGANISVSMPLAAVVAGLVLTAGAAYFLLGRGDDSPAGRGGQSLRGMRRKAGLKTLIALLENDATRRVLISLLRAIARRG